jgi:hypothetical protein
VSPIVLLTMTAKWTFACRHCWATVRATGGSALAAGFVGALLGISVDLWLLSGIDHLYVRGSVVPMMAVVFSRLFPRFEVVDPPVDAGAREIPRSTTIDT